MSGVEELDGSRALWNRARADLDSDEMLAQILDRGEIEAWRAVYRFASARTPSGADLRRRIVRIASEVPIGFPHLWLAAMRGLGETVDPYPDPPLDPGI